MNKALLACLAGLSTLALGACSTTPEPGEKIVGPEVIQTSTTTSTSRIIGIDQPSRTFTIERAGSQVTLVASEAVNNFDQFAVGDLVDTEYTESVVVHVQANDGSPRVNRSEQLDMAEQGANPNIEAHDTTELIADIIAIDLENKTVTLRGPNQAVSTLPVRRHPEHLDKVAVGDQVVVVHTKALALSLRKKDESSDSTQ
ncbi:hypothetical protein K0504_16580 [Neiella marina]|uniref:DUF5666 domain-containing protein n=1 Tax=Neiella holothuriorum TaxID=2870530 RepID=A0ABS7EM27_9GAMM|nr:hypothetical protein [Neiella holothuriorum]MBW8192656.1 hypothetical protein [Neiella holothuriorum]